MKEKEETVFLAGVAVMVLLLAAAGYLYLNPLDRPAAAGALLPADAGDSGSGVLAVELPVPKQVQRAKVQIVEYSDFQCPYCSRGAATVDRILQEYWGVVSLEYKHFPLPFHENAWKAAEAYEIAESFGKGKEYHDILFANQGALDVASLKAYARQLGISGKEFDELLDSGAFSGAVERDRSEGAGIGVQGTPTFFINGEKVVGAQPYEVFKEAIDAELAK